MTFRLCGERGDNLQALSLQSLFYSNLLLTFDDPSLLLSTLLSVCLGVVGLLLVSSY